MRGGQWPPLRAGWRSLRGGTPPPTRRHCRFVPFHRGDTPEWNVRGVGDAAPYARALRLPVVAARIARHVRLWRTAFRRNANPVQTFQYRLPAQTMHPSDAWRPMAAATGRLTERTGRRGRRPLRGTTQRRGRTWRPMAAATVRLTERAGRRGRRPLRGHCRFIPSLRRFAPGRGRRRGRRPPGSGEGPGRSAPESD